MSVTQQQIADKLQISRSLVAMALKGHASVAVGTQERVREAARELGYDENSNHAARQLINKRYGGRVRTNTIAVVFPPLGLAPRRIPFFTPLIEGMEAAGEALDLDICVCLMRSDNLPRLIQTNSVDGVIVLGEVAQHIDTIQERGMPVVAFQNIEKGENVHSIARDDRLGAYQATLHLLELGHRQIAFLGIANEPASELRQLGYRDAMQQAGVAVRREWIDCSFGLPPTPTDSYCSGCRQCAACRGWEALRDKNGGSPGRRPDFTAVVCHNDPVAMGVIDHAQRDGLAVPRDLSVTGFDDISSQYQFYPEVTSIRFPRKEMGEYAVQLLHQVIEVGDTSRFDHRVFPTELVIRQSTSVPLTS